MKVGDTASLYYCGAWPLQKKVPLGENYLLLLDPLAYISSVKKNDAMQPRQTQPLPCPPCPHIGQERSWVMMVSLFSLCLPGMRSGYKGELCADCAPRKHTAWAPGG